MDNRNYDFDGFTINLFYDEDGDWLAYFVELPNVSAFGNSPQKALDELNIAWEGKLRFIYFQIINLVVRASCPLKLPN